MVAPPTHSVHMPLYFSCLGETSVYLSAALSRAERSDERKISHSL